MAFVSFGLGILNLLFKSWALTCIWAWYLAPAFPAVDFGMQMAMGAILMSYMFALPALLAILDGKDIEDEETLKNQLVHFGVVAALLALAWIFQAVLF